MALSPTRMRGSMVRGVMSKWFNLFMAIGVAALVMLAPMHAAAQEGQEAPPVPPAEQLPVALLIDISSQQVLYAREADRRIMPASMTKVMTLFHAFELMEQGKLDPRQSFVMDADTWREWNGEGSTMWINAGDAVPVDALLTGIANISANDGSVLLAKGQAGSVEEWTRGMTQTARSIGMVNSHFGTPNGWPDEGRTFTTAHDLALLAQAMVRRHPGKYARYIGRRSFAYNGIEQLNHDPITGRVEGADGIKTGYTNEAGYSFLGSAKRDGQRLVMVMAGGTSYGERARAARSFINWGFDAFDRESLFAKGAEVGFAKVQNGSARSVGLRTDRPVYVNVPKGRGGDLRMEVHYDGPLRAPLAQGERVATLVVHVPDMEPARIPLVAASPVEEAGFLARIANGIAGWFG